MIAAAGNLNHDLLVKLVAKAGWFNFDEGPDLRPVPPVPPAVRTTKRVARETAQSHIVLGTETFPYTDRRREPLMLLNTVLGGGMSSRLFQRVREELGLAYAVYTYQSLYRAAGVTGVYVGTHPSTAEQAVEVIREELRRLADQGLEPSVLAEAKQQVKGQLTLSLESPTARMYRLAAVAMYGEPYRTIDQVLADIDRIEPEQVREVAAEFLDPQRQTVVWLGPN